MDAIAWIASLIAQVFDALRNGILTIIDFAVYHPDVALILLILSFAVFFMLFPIFRKRK